LKHLDWTRDNGLHIFFYWDHRNNFLVKMISFSYFLRANICMTLWYPLEPFDEFAHVVTMIVMILHSIWLICLFPCFRFGFQPFWKFAYVLSLGGSIGGQPWEPFLPMNINTLSMEPTFFFVALEESFPKC